MHPFDGQLCLFDITIPVDNYRDQHVLGAALRPLCKKFVFQKEKGEETDYVHWQVRVSLYKKTRFKAFMNEVLPKISGHWSVTSQAVHDATGGQFNYVMKDQTRLDGPWDDRDLVEKNLTVQLENYYSKDPYPWQVKAEELLKTYDERSIHFIYDPHYNSGKSLFCEDVEYRGIAEEIPSIMALAEDVMQFVMCVRTSKAYTFDMPAAMKKQKLHQMYMALEMLKNGFLYDKRYEGKKKRINRPSLMVFANSLPDQTLMAPDRWKIWYITKSKDLIEYYPGIESADPADPVSP